MKEEGFSWKVEKDAMEWEHAAEGIESLQEKINKINKTDDVTIQRKYLRIYLTLNARKAGILYD